MPAYDAETYIDQAIQSILNQSYENLEFIIINDGSTDNTEKIILSFKDERIRYYKNSSNLKIVKTLNKGLALAKGKYIIRMDADDISLPNRLEKQVSFMEANIDIGISGSSMLLLNKKEVDNRLLEVKTCFKQLKINLLDYSVIFHPTAIIRKDILIRHNLHYRNEYLYAEDYDLWVQISKVSKLGNIKDPLIKYRMHDKNSSILQKTKQKSTHIQIIKEQLSFISNRSIADKELNFFLRNENNLSWSGIKLVLVIYLNNFKKKSFDNKLFLIFLLRKIKTAITKTIIEKNFINLKSR